MNIGFLALHVRFDGCRSLKEKRSRLKPLLTRLRREFNVSVAEIDYQDTWQDALVGCVMLSNEATHIQRSLQQVAHWVETYWPDVTVLDNRIELL